MAMTAAVTLGATVCGAQVTNAAAASAKPAAAAHTTTPAARPASLTATLQAAISSSPASEARFLALERRTASTVATGNECLWFGSGLCLGFDMTGGDIISVGALVVAIISLVFQIKTASGKDKGDNEEKPQVTSGGSFIGCLSAYGTTVVVQSCNPVASTWILVPTGPSYALENLYWYDQNPNVNNYMLTAPSDTEPGQPYLHGAISGGEDLRTWYNTAGGVAPVKQPAA
jgi:hypothetical protein